MLFKRVCQQCTKLQYTIEWFIDHFYAFFIKHSMGHCGKNVMIKPSTSIFKGLENIYISEDVRIARYAVIYSTRAKVYIGSKVGIAPYFKCITGNHNVKCIGHYMFDGDYNKSVEDDKDVVIEGDSWIGINVTILAGVTTYVWYMRKDIEQYQYGKLIWGIVFGLCVLFTVFMILTTVLGFLNLLQ